MARTLNIYWTLTWSGSEASFCDSDDDNNDCDGNVGVLNVQNDNDTEEIEHITTQHIEDILGNIVK